MATSAQLTTWIAELEIAHHEFLVNGVEEYTLTSTRVRYISISEVRMALAGYKAELAALNRGGGSVTYARFGKTSSA